MAASNMTSSSKLSRLGTETEVTFVPSQMSFSKPRQMLNSRRNGSEDSHTSSSRFEEAMNNPNWRQRRSQARSSSSSFMDISSCDLNIPRAQKNTTAAGAQGAIGKISESDRQMMLEYAALFSRQALLSKSSIKGEDDWEKFDYGSLTENSSESTRSDRGALCQVVSHIELPKSISEEHGFCLIELCPVDGKSTSVEDKSGASAGDFPTIVEIEPWNTEHRRDCTDRKRQRGEFGAARNRRERSSQSSQCTSHTSFDLMFSDLNPFQKAHKAVLEDPAIAEIGSSVHTSGLDDKREDQDTKISPKAPPKPALNVPKPEEIAFHRMLQKLQRGKAATTQNTNQHESESVSAKEHPRQATSVDEHTPQAVKAEEACASYHSDAMCSRYGLQHVDAGSASELETKYSTWNPRAREFFSFTTDAPSKSTGTSEELSTETFLSQVALKNEPDLEYPPRKGPETDKSAPNPPPLLPMPLFDGATPLMLPPVVPMAPPFMPGVKAPHIHVPEPYSLPAVGGAPGIVPVALPGSLPFSQLPYMNVGPFQYNPVGPNLGLPPWLGGQPRQTHPGPVPKPRKPDPGDQQAYEAWIEWRKANEPGYALQCKLRQQRRAHRSRT
ncbi:hypothetical protein B0I35DRAFT_474816 [Stachybotrys elegans]|uniref:Uncharacterized protein n=1 Tax=Stachybotrys elegans TaxID=80388 RepID=A0A8K0T4T9_9HYPO|nr:hypothetical protein B0I35DRAFT_474816 [Stachybotrys elegans]